MLTVRQIVSLSLLLLLGACATGRDAVMQVMNEKYTGKVVSITDFKMGPKMGYTIEPAGLKLLSDLGVVCKDDDAMLQETYGKRGSVVYCENGVMAKNHVTLVKIAMAHDTGTSFDVTAMYLDAWALAKIYPKRGDSFPCTNRWASRGNSFSDCVLMYADKKYFISTVFFSPVKFDKVRQMMIFDDVRHMLIIGNVKEASEEDESKVRELSDIIAYAFRPSF